MAAIVDVQRPCPPRLLPSWEPRASRWEACLRQGKAFRGCRELRDQAAGKPRFRTKQPSPSPPQTPRQQDVGETALSSLCRHQAHTHKTRRILGDEYNRRHPNHRKDDTRPSPKMAQSLHFLFLHISESSWRTRTSRKAYFYEGKKCA